MVTGLRVQTSLLQARASDELPAACGISECPLREQDRRAGRAVMARLQMCSQLALFR